MMPWERRRAWRGTIRVMAKNGWLPDAGKCMTRIAAGRSFATFHPAAPEGTSRCVICGRVVMRGEGRWWL